MMKYLIGLLLWGWLCPAAQAQQGNVWVMGQEAGLDFNSGVPVPIQTAITSTNGEASAVACDPNGQLLFYTDGSYIWDRDHHFMPNGEDLLPGMAGVSLTSSTTQGTIIVPWPGNEDIYYVFSLVSMEYWLSPFSYGKLYYTVVDMSLNGGMGDVVAGQKGILIDSLFLEKMTAMVGGNCNIWLVTAAATTTSAYNSEFRAYEVSSSGLNLMPVVSEVGLGSSAFGCGVLVPAPDGQRLLATQVNGVGLGYEGAALFDFDPVTGLISNPQQLLPESGAYGACFSPDGTKVYVNETPLAAVGKIVQFDLNAGDLDAVIGSKTDLGNFGFAQVKLGPDGRVYFRPEVSMPSERLGVIQYPNLAGAGAQVNADGLELFPGTAVMFGLPNIMPVIHRDTFLSNQFFSAGCFAVHTIAHANNVVSGWGYLWNTGVMGATMIVDTPGTYWVSYYTAPCNFHTDTFHVTFPNGVLPTISVTAECRDDHNGSAHATTYPGDPVGYDYTWLQGADTLSTTDSLTAVPSGDYSLHVRTDTGCDTLLFFTIPEVDYRVGFTTSDTILCQGDGLQLENTSDGHFNQFAWYFGDGDSSATATAPDHIYPHAGSYEVMLTGEGTICKDTTRQAITVDSFFTPSFQVDQPEICVGDVIRFQLPVADTSFTGLYWDWGDGSYLSTDYAPDFYHAFDSSGNIPVRLTLHSRACPDTSFTDSITVYPLPRVNLGSDTSLCLDGHAVVLRNLATSPTEPYHYLWSTGDTTAGLRVLQPGSYSLRITTEPLGCNTTDVIEVTKDCYTDIPNAFTPNGDGDNDYFFPRPLLSKSVSAFKMQVFNRWGQLIFETTRIDGRGWDGRFNDKDQPLGVYIYLVDVVYSNGRQERYEGNVTLIR